MRALIPVAGEGTRLQPHTHTHPKPLLNVAGKPIISHIMDIILYAGVDDIVFITGYLGEKLERYLRKSYDIPMTFIKQEERLGIAHAVYMAKEHIRGEPVFIVLGDTIFDADVKSVFEGAKNALGVREVKNPSRFGIVVVENGRVVELTEKPEKPRSNLAIAGLYNIVETDLLLDSIEMLIKKDIRTKGEYQITDALQEMVNRGSHIETFFLEGWYDCGNAQSMLNTNRSLLDRNGSFILGRLNETVIIDPVAIADGSVIERSIIGPFVTVGGGTVIRDSRIRDAVIGREAELDNVILEQSLVGHNATLTGRFVRLNVGDSSELEIG